MITLEKVFTEERLEKLSKLNLLSTSHTIYQSTIIREDDDNPIYLTHQTLPEIAEISNEDEADPGFTGDGDDDYVSGDYLWLPILYDDITFTDLLPVTELGNVSLITSKGIFKLGNAILCDGCQLIYDESVLFV